VRLFSSLGLVVAPPACEPGQDTSAICLPRLDRALRKIFLKVSGYGYHSWLNHFFSEVSNPYLPAMLTKALLSGCPFTVFFPRHLAEILWLNNSFPDEASHGIVFPPLTFQVNYWPSSFSTDCPAMNFFLSISRHYGRLTQLASSYLFFTMMAFTPPHLFVHRNELKMINRSFYFRNK
jgi:hypothetical protein